jgi:hypothetical protein
MTLERYDDQHKQVVDKYVNLTAAYYMKTYDYVVRASAATATGNYTVYLPPVAEAKGRFYSIVATIANSTTITVASRGDAESWSNISLTVTGNRVLAYSDGMCWHTNSVTGS